MSLIHWWPLGENKNDIVGGAHLSGTYATSGKGKISAGCASEWGTRLSTSTSNLTGLKNFSIAMWVRLDSAANSSAWSDLFGMNMQKGSTTESLRAEVNATGGSALQLYCNAISGTDGGAANFTLTKDTWQHLVITKKGARLTSYINGSQVSYTDWSNIADAYCTGEFHLSDGGFYCSYNDVRLYNHVLSTKEIKELSKALVLHYTFDNSSFEPTTNLLSDRITNFSSSPLGTYSGFENQMGTGSLIEVRDFQNKRCLYIRGGSGFNDRCFIYKDVAGSTKYTFSCDFYSSSQITLRAEGNGGGYGSGWPEVGRVVYSTLGQWQRVSCTMDVAASPRLYLFFVIPNGVECYINNLQLEEKDHTTTYTPTSRTSCIGDGSGLGNDGVLVLPEYYSFTQDSILGTGALYSAGNSDGTAYIKTTLNPSFIAGTGTICFWYKKNTGSAGFLVATPDPGNQKHYLWANSPGKDPWNDGGASYSHWYIDGVQGKTPVSDTDWHFYCIAGVNISGWTSFAIQRHGDGSWLYRGKIADFRVYNTVLDSDEIQTMYKARWAANKQGQVFSNAINEGQSKFQITRGGVNNCNTLTEISDTYEVIDYVEATSNRVIDTEVDFNPEYDAVELQYSSNVAGASYFIAGCGSASGSGIFDEPYMWLYHYGTTVNGYIQPTSKTRADLVTNSGTDTHKHIMKYNNKTFYYDNLSASTSLNLNENFGHFYLFNNTKKHMSYATNGKIYYCKIWKNGVLTRNMIPAKRIRDGATGFLDGVTKKFYTDNGSSSTTATVSQSRDGSLHCAEFNEI